MKKRLLLKIALVLSITINVYFIDKITPGLSVFVSTLTTNEKPYQTADQIDVNHLFVAWHNVGAEETEEAAETEVDFCNYKKPDKETYTGKLVDLKKPETVEPGEFFKVKIYVENTGTARWFSDSAGCKDGKTIRLGTINSESHPSRFWTDSKEGYNGWLKNEDKNRVELLQHYIDPGQTATFIFWAKAPDEPDLYREIFSLRLNEEKWVDDPKFAMDVAVGTVTEEMRNKMKVVFVEARSQELEGEKNLEVDLSTQTMYLKLGEKVIKNYTISSGQPVKHPTPTGDYKILFKQPLRVGGKWPNYHMRFWQAWRADGYGLHALPSLENDKGQFWSEALDHIGRPVSHGCIRMLDWDAEELYNWTDVGTKIVTHQ